MQSRPTTAAILNKLNEATKIIVKDLGVPLTVAAVDVSAYLNIQASNHDNDPKNGFQKDNHARTSGIANVCNSAILAYKLIDFIANQPDILETVKKFSWQEAASVFFPLIFGGMLIAYGLSRSGIEHNVGAAAVCMLGGSLLVEASMKRYMFLEEKHRKNANHADEAAPLLGQENLEYQSPRL